MSYDSKEMKDAKLKKTIRSAWKTFCHYEGIVFQLEMQRLSSEGERVGLDDGRGDGMYDMYQDCKKDLKNPTHEAAGNWMKLAGNMIISAGKLEETAW